MCALYRCLTGHATRPKHTAHALLLPFAHLADTTEIAVHEALRAPWHTSVNGFNFQEFAVLCVTCLLASERCSKVYQRCGANARVGGCFAGIITIAITVGVSCSARCDTAGPPDTGCGLNLELGCAVVAAAAAFVGVFIIVRLHAWEVQQQQQEVLQPLVVTTPGDCAGGWCMPCPTKTSLGKHGGSPESVECTSDAHSR
jgi:hypothetical protein